MNTGQMLMTIAGAVLISITILTINNRTMSASTTMDQTKLELMAISLANSKIDEVRSKKFDNTSSPSNLNDLTLLNNFGPDGTETIYDYDDCDDYNNASPEILKVIVNPNEAQKREAEFKIKTTVSYAEIVSNQVVKVTAGNKRTWHKLIEVEVTNDFLPNPIKMSAVNSYYNL